MHPWSSWLVHGRSAADVENGSQKVPVHTGPSSLQLLPLVVDTQQIIGYSLHVWIGMCFMSDTIPDVTLCKWSRIGSGTRTTLTFLVSFSLSTLVWCLRLFQDSKSLSADDVLNTFPIVPLRCLVVYSDNAVKHSGLLKPASPYTPTGGSPGAHGILYPVTTKNFCSPVW